MTRLPLSQVSNVALVIWSCNSPRVACHCFWARASESSSIRLFVGSETTDPPADPAAGVQAVQILGDKLPPKQGETLPPCDVDYQTGRVSQLRTRWSDREVKSKAGSATLPLDRAGCLGIRFSAANEAILPTRPIRRFRVNSPLPMLRSFAIVAKDRTLCKCFFSVQGSIVAGARGVMIYI